MLASLGHRIYLFIRVLSVPVSMGALVFILYYLAAPADDLDDDDSGTQKA